MKLLRELIEQTKLSESHQSIRDGWNAFEDSKAANGENKAVDWIINFLIEYKVNIKTRELYDKYERKFPKANPRQILIKAFNENADTGLLIDNYWQMLLDGVNIRINSAGQVICNWRLDLNDMRPFEKPPFKFEYVYDLQIDNIHLSESGTIKELEDWFPAKANNVRMDNTGVYDFHNIDKILKVCETLVISYNPQYSENFLGLLKIKGLREFKLSYTTKDRDEGLKLLKILRKYLPEGDLFDCQEELIEAGFEKVAGL
jgi:hypothetical protein